ncbi:hypothetical protein Cgig2_028017 [Carnegiea gigantea]|uniref:protein-serine/threonine phosphatase n=1 Tax=Carnegiea gigantea TaxID=171969 RepID=A0A9Q1JPV1_9CARY|nr:hypothetical protein Cgig2_028017 [Carnegiea gigantea]
MAGMCCGINVGETEPTSPVEPAARTGHRRRVELRQLKIISDMAEARMKRQKVGEEEKVEEEQIQLRLPASLSPPPLEVARECDNASENCSEVVAKTDGEEQAVVEEFPKFGVTSVCGRRRDMEDAISIRPSFCSKRQKTSHQSEGFHLYGVFDGHGCSHVAMKCKERMHAIIKEEIESRESEEWSETMIQSFTRMDSEVGERLANAAGDVSSSCRCELQTPQCDAVGSTAVVAVVTPEKIVVSNCGDSRAVLCRNGVAIPLSVDHKPDRPDELKRIEEAGGRVIYWDGPRVLGMLAMSRAIGDNYLKPYVIPDPEVTVTDRSPDDECLILASDGLWDVVPNETAVSVARMCLNAEKPPSPPRSPGNDAVIAADGESSDKACSDASILLTKLALARHSCDNVSVVVVDLRRNPL